LASAFFGLPDEYKIELHKECAMLAYATNGGYPFHVAYSMPVHLRKFHLRYISSLKEKEKKDTATNKDKPPKIHRPNIRTKK
jgi:hypothetical protein